MTKAGFHDVVKGNYRDDARRSYRAVRCVVEGTRDYPYVEGPFVDEFVSVVACLV